MATLLIACTITLIASAVGLEVAINQPHTVAAVTVVIPPGTSARQSITLLAGHRVITHPILLRIYARLHHVSVQSGWYHFNGTITPQQALTHLTTGKVMQFSVTIAEGLRSEEIKRQLAKQTGLPLARWQQAWHQLAIDEGTLLPNSWRYTKPVHPQHLLERMLQAQTTLLTSLDADKSDWPRLRTIASMIEKETAIDTERPIISAVIANRLRRHMPLQIDPTVIYGIYQRDGSFSGNITRRDLHANTPWNTYRHKGLPPTPICHPGSASLRAAAQPASSDALYFVADGHGGHRFATTLATHQRNVAHWLRTAH
ncbi:MAG: endolytic transglycosylase MltG [Mariprofundales bacterium]|nr:endolytic transglycosylase MltG [Mariprofundales bacterium]